MGGGSFSVPIDINLRMDEVVEPLAPTGKLSRLLRLISIGAGGYSVFREPTAHARLPLRAQALGSEDSESR